MRSIEADLEMCRHIREDICDPIEDSNFLGEAESRWHLDLAVVKAAMEVGQNRMSPFIQDRIDEMLDALRAAGRI